jgi:ammonium transporter, Amt family
MQAGFLWLETGLVRAKSSVNIAIKNMMDFCVSAAMFWAIGSPDRIRWISGQP